MKGIYIISNTTTDMVYIGSSVDIQGRFRHHKSLLSRNRHQNKHLQNSWNKYGKESFEFSILEETEDLIGREQYWMDQYENKCNFLSAYRRAGEFHHSEEAKIKIGQAASVHRLGSIHTLETRSKIGDRCRGKSYEELYGKEKAGEMREAIRQRNLNREYKTGFTRSQESKKKQSESMRGKSQSDEKKEKCRTSKIGNKNPQYKEIPNDIRMKIVSLYLEKHSSRRQIALTLGYTQHIISKVLKEEGIL